MNLNGRSRVIENGGFPINFDRQREQEDAQRDLLTRALVLAGIFQALCVKIDERREGAIMLSPCIQRALVSKWLELTAQKADRFLISRADNINSLNWWRSNSFGGEPIGRSHAAPAEVECSGSHQGREGWTRRAQIVDE